MLSMDGTSMDSRGSPNPLSAGKDELARSLGSLTSSSVEGVDYSSRSAALTRLPPWLLDCHRMAETNSPKDLRAQEYHVKEVLIGRRPHVEEPSAADAVFHGGCFCVVHMRLIPTSTSRTVPAASQVLGTVTAAYAEAWRIAARVVQWGAFSAFCMKRRSVATGRGSQRKRAGVGRTDYSSR